MKTLSSRTEMFIHRWREAANRLPAGHYAFYRDSLDRVLQAESLAEAHRLAMEAIRHIRLTNGEMADLMKKAVFRPAS